MEFKVDSATVVEIMEIHPDNVQLFTEAITGIDKNFCKVRIFLDKTIKIAVKIISVDKVVNPYRKGTRKHFNYRIENLNKGEYENIKLDEQTENIIRELNGKKINDIITEVSGNLYTTVEFDTNLLLKKVFNDDSSYFKLSEVFEWGCMYRIFKYK